MRQLNVRRRTFTVKNPLLDLYVVWEGACLDGCLANSK